MPADLDAALLSLMHAIAEGHGASAREMLAATPALATARLAKGATRAASERYFFPRIGHYAYAGATALHVAAAAHDETSLDALLKRGADVHAVDRRGAQPLHAAATARPGSPTWDPRAQGATLRRLLAAGADPNAADKNGATPLHRAARTRGAAAVATLLDHGADAALPNRAGTTALRLAQIHTGRSGASTPEAKREQAEILALLQGQRAR